MKSMLLNVKHGILQIHYVYVDFSLLFLYVFLFCFCNIRSYYPVTLFCLVGVTQPFIVSIILGPINLIAAILSAMFIDKVSEKTAA